MANYKESMVISASPDQVFDFVADVRNMPMYLPTTKSAQPQGKERVRVQGEVQGHRYDADGYLRTDRENYRMEWGADERYYSGSMQIKPQGEQSQVTVEISFRDWPPSADGQQGPTAQQIQEGLRAALESIQRQLTGQGGKVEPQSVTRQPARAG